ncbi:MAG TPA: hypothetical protein VNA25_04725 [Phycisphaerae bacterium]|nr:hypothetical protein [Phycisphaerae bacterium]
MAKLAGGLTPLEPLLGQKRKKARDDYSIDLDGDRRKRKRVSIKELSERGADALRERAPELADPDKRGMVTRVLDVLDVPRNIIANTIASITGTMPDKPRRGTLLKKVYVSDILGKLGVPKGPVRSIVGFVGDVAFDPWTYYGLGATAGVRVAAHLPKIIGPVAKAIKVAGKTGRIAGELTKAVGVARTAKLEKAFRAVVAAKGMKAAQKRMAETVARRLGTSATRGAPEALALFAKHGEKGRTIFRLPFAAKGIGTLPFGAKARQYKPLTEGGEAWARLAAKKAGARAASAGAAQAAKAETTLAAQLTKAKAAWAAKQAHLLQLATRYKVRKEGMREIGRGTELVQALKGTKEAVRTPEVRRAIKAYEAAQKHAQSLEARAKSAGEAISRLSGKFEVSPEAAAKIKRTLEVGVPPKGSVQSARRAAMAARTSLTTAEKAAPQLKQASAFRQRFETPISLAKGEAKAAGAGAKSVEAQARAAVQATKAKQLEAEAARIARVAFETSPEAPGVIRELGRVQRGTPFERLAPGMANWIRGLKRQIVGPEPSYASQKIVGAGQRGTVGRALMRGKAGAEYGTKVEAALPRLVREGRGSADELRAALRELAEAGPDALRSPNIPGKPPLQAFRSIDPIQQRYAKAIESGLTQDPEVQKVLADYWQNAHAMWAAEKARGFPGRERAGYVSSPFTPEAAKRQQMTLVTGRRPPKPMPGGVGSQRQAPTMGHGYFRVVTMPDRTQRHVLSSAADADAQIQAFKATGGKETGRQEISRLQWDEWARDPSKRPIPIALEFKDAPAIKEGMFQSGLPAAAGQRAGSHEAMMGAADVRDLVGQWRVSIPKGQSEKLYPHLSKPIKPDVGNPFSALGQTGLYDYYYPTEITEMLDGLTKVWDQPDAIEAMLRASDRALGVWKSFQLYHPGYAIRNVFEKPLGALLEGVNPVRATWRAMIPSTHTLRNALVENVPDAVMGQTIQLAGRNVPMASLFEKGRQLHVIGGGRTAVEAPARFGATTTEAVAGKAAKGWNRIHSAIFRGNAAFEDHQKLGVWLELMDQGLSAEDAMLRTLRAAPDMADLPTWTKMGIGRLLPWFRWRIKNGSRMLFHFLPQKPAYFTMLSKFQNAWENWRQQSVPEELRPQWMQDQQAFQISGDRDSGVVFTPQNWLPFDEPINAMGMAVDPQEAVRRGLGELHPMAKGLIEMGTGQSLFRKTPLEPPTLRSIPAALAGSSNTALDSMIGLRPAREWGPGGRLWQMPTAGRKAARLFLGGAVQPMDYQRGLMANYYEMDRKQRELRAQYNRALQVKDKSLAESLLRQWTQIIRQMYQYRFPLPRAAEQSMASAGVPRTGPP